MTHLPAGPRAKRRFEDAALAGWALVAAAAALVVSRRGLFFTPDSWAYWEGSVSLLAGRGYRFLGGRAIGAWPPLTSLYLALWQLAFGTSIETLRWALAGAAAAHVVVWTRLGRALGARGAWTLAPAVALFAAFAARENSWLLSESLTLPLLGGALLALARAGTRRGKAPFVAAGCWMTALLLTRHASFAFLPPMVAGAPWLAPGGGRRRLYAGSSAAAGAATGIWIAAQAALDQLGSHPLATRGFGGQLETRLGEILRGLAGRSGDALAGWGALLPLALGAAFVLAWARRRETAGQRALALLAIALGSSLLLAPLAALTPVADRLEGRFLWPVLPLLAAALLALIGEAGARRVAWWVLAAVAVVAVARWGDAAWRFRARPFERPAEASPSGLLAPALRLDAGYVFGPPVRQEDGGWLIAPPPDLPRAHRRPARSRPAAQLDAGGGGGGAEAGAPSSE